jgi:hypothetical protein
VTGTAREPTAFASSMAVCSLGGIMQPSGVAARRRMPTGLVLIRA